MEEKEELRQAVFINGNRTCYHPSQCEDYTCTVGDLRDFLERFDDDAKVFLRNDNGYSYGQLDCYDDVYVGEYDDEEVYIDEE